jgi:hypothetical protein
MTASNDKRGGFFALFVFCCLASLSFIGASYSDELLTVSMSQSLVFYRLDGKFILLKHLLRLHLDP